MLSSNSHAHFITLSKHIAHTPNRALLPSSVLHAEASFLQQTAIIAPQTLQAIMAGLMDKVIPILVSEVYRAVGFRLIDNQIVPRRDTIIRRGRRIQNILHIPIWAHVFTETDPGMPDKDIRLAAQFVFTAFTTFAFGLLMAFTRGSLWNICSLAFMIVIPGCLLTLLWVGMAFSRRRRASDGETVFRLRRGMDERGRTRWCD